MMSQAVPSSISEPPLLARLSVSLFATVTGTGGLGNAWAVAAGPYGAARVIGQVLPAPAGGLFILLALQVVKTLRHPEAILEAWRHPVRSSFFPIVSWPGSCCRPGLGPTASRWRKPCGWPGAVLHLALGPLLIRRWITHLVAMLLASLASRLAHGAFVTGWWAMTFPADAWAGATPAYAHARPTSVTYAVASAALGVATAIVAVVGRRTLRAVASGAAFRED